MTLLLLADSISLGSGWIGILVKLGIIAIIIWAVWALLNAFGIGLHPAVRIILIAIVSIVALIVLANLIASIL